MTGTQAYVLLNGMRGKACRIEKIEAIQGGHRVTFVWNEETAAYVVGDTIWTVDGSYPATPEIEVNWWREQNASGTLIAHDLQNETEVKLLDAPRVGGKVRRKTMDVMDGALFVDELDETLLTEFNVGFVRYLMKEKYDDIDPNKLKYGVGWYIIQEKFDADGNPLSPRKFYWKYVWHAKMYELPSLTITNPEWWLGQVVEYVGETDLAVDSRLYNSPVLVSGQKYRCKYIEKLDWSDPDYPNGKSFSPKQYTYMWLPFWDEFVDDIQFTDEWKDNSFCAEAYVVQNTATINIQAKHTDDAAEYQKVILTGLPKPMHQRYIELITGGFMNVVVPCFVQTDGTLKITGELPYGDLSGKFDYKIV